MLVDTHAHLDDRQFDPDRDAVIQRAFAAGVVVITVGVDLASSRTAVELAAHYPGVYAAVGIHPHEAVAATPEAMDELRLLARQTKVVAIGETGLDWHRNLAPRQAQIAAFSAHLAVAAELDLPVIIHSREADADVLAVWRTVPGGRGVLHAFSGDSAMAEAALAEGLYIAFGGPLTYKNAEAKRAIARQIPLDRLLIETDCPLLPPVPWRGRRNEPAYVALVNEALAHVLGRPAQDMGAQATRNAQALFKLPDRVEDR